MTRRVTVDFETEAIEGRASGRYPPKPVGLALHQQGRAVYYAWAHDSENNCTFEDARNALRVVWNEELIFHNAAFDIEVAMVHFHLPWPRLWQDTLIMAYLADPRARSFGLKELAAQHLGMEPDEQDDLKEWILTNIPAAKKSTWGAFIARAPGDLAGRYAKGDVIRTAKLFPLYRKHLLNPLPDDPDVTMVDAYERECELIRVKLNMEQRGIRVDTARLNKEIPIYEEAHEFFRQRLRRKLKVTNAWEASNDFDGPWNPDSGDHLADALEHSGHVRARDWIRTPTGKRSTSRANLEACIKDAEVRDLLNLYTISGKYLSTFLRPWAQASANDGYIHTNFNTIRSTDENGRPSGTTTGRLSSGGLDGVNLQNIPASVDGSAHEAALRLFQSYLRKQKVDFVGLRDYFIPDKGCVFLNRDYSQQEFRILAHYENGPLLERYAQDPKVDFHTLVQAMVQEASGSTYARKPIKNINFGIIYGMGVALLSGKTGLPFDEAKALKSLILTLIPGIKNLQKSMKAFARTGSPISTHGGRLYYCEPDAMINGERRSFDYKMLNLLIQGSAADCTKQAMLQVYDAVGPDKMVLQVHDELMLSVPIGQMDQQMRLMREAMEDMQYDVPMLTEGKTGTRSWARMAPYKDRREE